MKLDFKITVIIVLVGVIGILTGFIVGRKNNEIALPATTTAIDGKLAKEYKEQVLVKTIRENAKDLQQCYFALLDSKPKVTEGSLTVLIKVEEDGKISSAKITKNEFQDPKLEGCVSQKLESYYLAPPPMGINRNISHVLAFKTEETAQKEARAREAKSRPPKLFPVK
ncbi:AgmX/PglI C-terminal domain-containing protein [Peredibacter starrii]|uniref:AgmX/PglI C-terminal domain-containing protein n=1 Tax=Peredibacter starrii TaxID=28202 RepID=A0AAX4HKP0_9BACT|nr:AgmX/PglI C-terminal domain-containing protein [Peredibacter starrii]WPU63801.1 AgmX/PglI C-terminal domain-containing protein [Peredibacter starrii]